MITNTNQFIYSSTESETENLNAVDILGYYRAERYIDEKDTYYPSATTNWYHHRDEIGDQSTEIL